MQSRNLKEDINNLAVESDFDLDFEDPEFCLDSCVTTKYKNGKFLQIETKSRVVRINSKPTVEGPLPTVMMPSTTYRMPSHYYSLPKYEWKQFYFLQPLKSSLKSISCPTPAQQNLPSTRQQKVQPLAKQLKLPSIEEPWMLSATPLRGPPTWPEIIGAEFPVDPPMSRLMFTRSPTKLLTPLVTSPKQPSQMNMPASLGETQSKSKQKYDCNLQLFKPCIKVTKQKSMEIGDPTKMEKYCEIQFDGCGLPIVYHENYNLKVLPYSMHRFQPMIPDKAEKVYSILKSEYLEGYEAIKWTGVDISTVYNIDDFVPEFIKEVNVKFIAHVMQLHMLMSVISLDHFDSAILQPLRVQTMGSVVACKLAMEEGWAINIGGGFKHYTTNISSAGGLALYDDILMCLAIMSRSPQVKNILVVNVDAYQLTMLAAGYGQTIALQDFIKRLRKCLKILQDHCRLYAFMLQGQMHMKKITVLLSLSLKNEQEVIKRDEEVFELIHKTYQIPMAILLGGGFHPCDAEVAAATINNLCHIGIPLLRQIHDQEVEEESSETEKDGGHKEKLFDYYLTIS